MISERRLTPEEKEELLQRLGNLLSQLPEVTFACVHGSFLEVDRGFRDIDIAVWLDPSKFEEKAELDYRWELSSWLERAIPHPVDVQVLNHSSLGFKYAASGGVLLWSKNPTHWYDFRAETWQQYLDFAPLARRMLMELLGSNAE